MNLNFAVEKAIPKRLPQEQKQSSAKRKKRTAKPRELSADLSQERWRLVGKWDSVRSLGRL